MSHQEHHEKKKLKKLHQLLQNRKMLHSVQQEETLARSRDLDREREEDVREQGAAASRRAGAGGDKPVWSAKMQEIRDKNTGRKRMATERWNRFAGTESGGGRGL